MTDQDLESDLRRLLGGYADTVPERSITAVSTRVYHPRTHSYAPAVTAGIAAVIAAAAAGGIGWAATSHGPASGQNSVADQRTVATPAGTASASRQTTPADTGPTIQLAGYRLEFPASFTVGQTDTNCTGPLHLDPDEQQRTVTTSPGSCPLLITSVVRDLPPGTTESGLPFINADGTVDEAKSQHFFYINGADGNYAVVYQPVQIPGGAIVYVTLDWSTHPNVDSLIELEHGLTVQPAPVLPSCTPNCTASGG